MKGDKPKFGVGSASEEQAHKENAKSKFQEKKNNTKENGSNEWLSFGVQAKQSHTDNELTSSFGTDSNKELTKKITNYEIVKGLFSLQDKKFWISSYIFSIIIFVLELHSFETFTLLSLILFPFSLIIIEELAFRLERRVPLIAKFLYPRFNKLGEGTSLLFIFVWFILKLFFLVFVWNLSWALGVMGIIYMIMNILKMYK